MYLIIADHSYIGFATSFALRFTNWFSCVICHSTWDQEDIDNTMMQIKDNRRDVNDVGSAGPPTENS
jgi:hypothetical protein